MALNRNSPRKSIEPFRKIKLDQITSNPSEGLQGVIVSDHVGVTGFSGDGVDSLAVSGVRVEPDYYRNA